MAAEGTKENPWKLNLVIIHQDSNENLIEKFSPYILSCWS